MRTALISSALGLFAAAFLAAQSPDASLDGDWVGDVHVQGDWQFAMLHIAGERSGIQGTLQMPFASQQLTLGDIHMDAASVTFRSDHSGGSLVFAGVLTDGVLKGSVRTALSGDSTDSFTFAHIARVDA